MNNTKYDSLIDEGKELLLTFTITYPYGPHMECLYSNTYDELSKWLRGTIQVLKVNSAEKFDDPFIQYLNSFRGKLGNIDKKEFKKILLGLEERSGSIEPILIKNE